MYLPLMALAVLAMAALDVAARHVRASPPAWAARARRWTPIAVAVAIASVLAPMTMARNKEYASALTLARTVVERRPTAIARHILAEQLLFAGQRDEAARQLREAVDGGNSRARYVLGRLLLEDGERTEGIEQLQAYLQTSGLPYRLVPRWLEPPLQEVVVARYALAQAFGQEERWSDAREQAEKILQIAPTHIPTRGLLADIMFAQQQWPDAAVRYREYLDRRPNDIQALINYGVTQVAVDRLDEAIAVFTRAAELDPANARARQLLTMAREDRARLAAAR
jgi:tetratricopeptide (TPR) repeat protein